MGWPDKKERKMNMNAILVAKNGIKIKTTIKSAPDKNLHLYNGVEAYTINGIDIRDAYKEHQREKQFSYR
jgi:hypothetical protein